MIHLLDTDTFILLIRGTAIRQAKTAREQFVQQAGGKILASCKKRQLDGHVVGLSAITLAELEFGLHQSGSYAKKEPVLRKLAAPFTTFPFDTGSCVLKYGLVRHTLETKGRGIGSLDTLIASHALALGAVLVTHNQKEFKRGTGLQLEDWAD